MDNENTTPAVTETEETTTKREGKIFTPFCIVCLSIGVIAVAVSLLCIFSAGSAEWYNRTVGQYLRTALGVLTGWIPFSIAECFLLSMLPLAIAYCVASSRAMRRSNTRRTFLKRIVPLISVLVLLASSYMLTFGTANYRLSLDENIGLTRAKVSASELTETADKINEQIAQVIGDITFAPNGSSVMPYDYYELCKKMNDAYETYCEKNDYISTFRAMAKPVALSEPMTYTHIAGVYSFFSGESNVNINYPDFVIPYTMAHEMAHQRGIARETEANFVAFLVCMESDDAYIKYSALVGMQEYMLSAIGSADNELYAPAFYSLDNGVIKELRAYSTFFDKYRTSTAAKVADKVNDAFLQVQGQKEGTRSYGLVVDLTVAYYKDK